MPPPAAADQEPHAAPPAARPARRELGLALVAGAAGAGIVLFAAGQPWARASFAPAPPLPASSVTLTGHELVPAAGALGLAALACLAALIATRGMARRAVGALLAAAGVVTAIAATTSVGHTHVLTVAAAHTLAAPRAPHVAVAAFPWWAAAASGGLVIVITGMLAVWRGTQWAGMSSRYDRPGGSRRPVDDPATTWDELDRGADPTIRGSRR
jgi:uncharacterized membrane protein (TIGR02234 family)